MPNKLFSNLCCIFSAGTILTPLYPALAAAPPEGPRAYVDTTYAPPQGGTVHQVRTNCTGVANCASDPQAAINAANLGDIIEIEAGARFQGKYFLPNKTTGSGWIYIRSSRHAELPPPGTRVGPQHAALMPKLVSRGNEGFVLGSLFGAHHYRLIGIEFTKDTGNSFSAQIISLGRDGGGPPATSLSQLPHHIIFDRVWIHGTPTDATLEGVRLDGMDLAVIDSHISDIHKVGNGDTQAILALNSAGPLKIVNNYLSSAGENVMFGGGDPTISVANGGISASHRAAGCYTGPALSTSPCGMLPSDIEIRGNYFHKPLTWNRFDPSYAGIRWGVKNLFEIKNAQRIIVQGNIFENSWVDAQVGFGLVFTPRNQQGTAPWTTIRDLKVENNLITNTNNGFGLLVSDNKHITESVKRLSISNNIWDSIANNIFEMTRFPYTNPPAPAFDPGTELSIEHNTWLHKAQGRNFLLLGDQNAHLADRIDYRSNIMTEGANGIGGLMSSYWTNYDFSGNLIIHNAGRTGSYAGNAAAPSISSVQFVDYSGGNYALSSGSPYRNSAADGKDPGADAAAVSQAVACVRLGTCSTPPDRTPPSRPSQLRIIP